MEVVLTYKFSSVEEMQEFLGGKAKPAATTVVKEQLAPEKKALSFEDVEKAVQTYAAKKGIKAALKMASEVGFKEVKELKAKSNLWPKVMQECSNVT